MGVAAFAHPRPVGVIITGKGAWILFVRIAPAVTSGIASPMTDKLPFTVKPVYWNATEKVLRAIRTQVFVEEQGVPVELEWDGLDEHAYHVVAYGPDGLPIGTGRLL